MASFFKKILRTLTRRPQVSAWVVLMYDGHRYYWSSNVFTSQQAARKWAADYNMGSMSVVAEKAYRVDIVHGLNGQVDRSINDYGE